MKYIFIDVGREILFYWGLGGMIALIDTGATYLIPLT